MKKIFQLSFLLLCITACNNSDENTEEAAKPENGMDAAGKFLRAALDGDYKKARPYMVNDSTNMQLIDLYEWKHKNLTPDEKKGYQNASIRFLNDTRQLNDSTTIIHYSNSYKNIEDSLKIIKISGQWFVDMNFTFQKNDSIPQ